MKQYLTLSKMCRDAVNVIAIKLNIQYKTWREIGNNVENGIKEQYND